jgi:hypothetical protein
MVRRLQLYGHVRGAPDRKQHFVLSAPLGITRQEAARHIVDFDVAFDGIEIHKLEFMAS